MPLPNTTEETDPNDTGNTMTRPNLLDLYCCQGGAARGYQMAGFHVTGVDIAPQPRYVGNKFIQGNALEFLAEHGAEYDAIHASPPCQHASAGTRTLRARGRSQHPALIEPTRELLDPLSVPWVIENVSGAALVDPMVLCGSMFDLTATDTDGVMLHLRRHRLFESNVPLAVPRTCRHPRGVQWAGSYGGARRDKDEARHVRHGGYVPSAVVQQRLLGIDWMTEAGMYQSIPPTYTAHVGEQLMARIPRT